MISVCMPYRMRQETLNRSLAAYRALYDDIEISICDDGSPEPVVAEDCILTHLPARDHALNPCVPINIAINQSHGDLICLSNPETFHTTPILEKMADTIRDDMDYVIAAVQNEQTGRWLCKSTYTGSSWMPIPSGAGFHFCVMFTRILWEKAGGFDEEFRDGQGCDDNDWCWRAHAAGANFIYRDDLVALNAKAPRTEWPEGGMKRNSKLLKQKWSHLWH